MQTRCLVAALVLLLGSSAATCNAASIPEYEGFIRVQNNRFVDANCRDFPVTGVNTWMLMEAAAGLTYQPCSLPNVNEVQYTFSTAAANGFTVARVFAHGVNNTLVLQTSPGTYNETAFAALDYILDTAAYNNVKVIFTFGDNWQFADSKRNYNTWAGFDEDSDEFFTSDVVKQMYKNHIETVVNRVNTLTGLAYKDDPTIFAWNLMNEPRCNCFPAVLPYPAVFATLPAGCAPSCADSITTWVGEMADFVKSVDPNHLVTVGEEGFWGYNDANIGYNPENSVSPWAALTGNNFTAQHSFNSIDYMSIHYWPDQWTPKATSDGDFFYSWIKQHEAIATTFGKPLVLEELGKQVEANISLNTLESQVLETRQPFMQMVYSAFNQSIQTGQIWRGVLLWKWGMCPQNTQTNPLEVSAGDADFQNVIAPAALAALSFTDSELQVADCTLVEVSESTNGTFAYAPTGGSQLAPSQAYAPVQTQQIPVLPRTVPTNPIQNAG